MIKRSNQFFMCPQLKMDRPLNVHQVPQQITSSVWTDLSLAFAIVGGAIVHYRECYLYAETKADGKFCVGKRTLSIRVPFEA